MANPSPPNGTQGYGAEAERLVERYEKLTFADVHRNTLHLFPQPPASVLDIGAGTGRDAAALARQGHRLVAVEPTPELRKAGQQIHADVPIDWVDDGLPGLNRLLEREGRFDLILLTAVWMHLDAAERRTAMARLARLLAPSGTIIMSLRHGPVPEGRRMFDVSAEETAALGRISGLECIFSGERDDMLGRADVGWSLLALRAG